MYTFFGTWRGYDLASDLSAFYRNIRMGGFSLLLLIIPLVFSLFTSYFRAVVSGLITSLVIFVIPLFFMTLSGAGSPAGFAPLGAMFAVAMFLVVTSGVVFVLGNFFRLILNIQPRWVPTFIFLLILVFIYGIIGYKLVDQISLNHIDCETVGQSSRVACHLKVAEQSPSIISCNILTNPLSQATCYGVYAYREKDGLVCNELTKNHDVGVYESVYEQCARVYKNLSAKDW